MAKHIRSPLSPYPEWLVVGWTRALLSLPSGPKEVVPGWTFEAAEEAGRGKEDAPVVWDLPPSLKIKAVTAIPWFRLSGVIHARTIDDARAIARDEMGKIISVLSLVLQRSMDGIAAVEVLSQFRRSGPAEFQSKMSGEIDLGYGTLSPIESETFSDVKELWNALESCPSTKLKSCLERSLGWFRKAAFDTDSRNRLLFCWTAVEALSYAIHSTKSTTLSCQRCKKGLKCANCDQEAVKVGVDGPIPLKELLINRYGIMGKREFENLRLLRNRLVHGSDDPTLPLDTWMGSLVDGFVDMVGLLIRKVLSDPNLTSPALG